MELKLINNDVLKEHAISHVTAIKEVTTMSGRERAQVQDLNKRDKKADAQTIEKAHTLKVVMDFGRVPLDKLVEMAKESQIVPIQNGILRPLGDVMIRKVCGKAEDVDTDETKDKGYSIKDGVLRIHINTWIKRSGRTVGDPVQKTVTLLGKLSEEDQAKVIVHKISEKKNISLEEAEKFAKENDLI